MRSSCKIFYCLIVSMFVVLFSCREDDIIFIPEEVTVASPEYGDIGGFYLLNEGNMGSNKCTLDYYDYSTGVYMRNIYGNANPSVPKELGDVGNDLAVYGSKLYAVVNCSNKVEVMDVANAKRVGQIDIPNCRFIKCYNGYVYVTSYAGPVEISPTYQQKGYVAKVDTATLAVVDRCEVGFQPDGLEIVDGKIYVANSGGYMMPNYENTLSVIDVNTFKEERRIEVALNLHKVVGDKRGGLWISSRGDYLQESPKLVCYDVRKQRITDVLDIPVGDMWLDGDSLYITSTSWSEATMSNSVSYAVVDVKTRAKVSDSFITDGTQGDIAVPYSVAVNPYSKDIYITDAKTYVNPGMLHCYSKEGVRKWSVRTGDVPAHIAFVHKVATPDVWENSQPKRYISKVWEFVPAPGQFVNEIPKYEVGDDEAAMIAKCEAALCGGLQNGLVSLGGYGGYITFSFDHAVENVEGEYDFRVLGNAGMNGAEPGIVMVMCDENGNGEPDDVWYELAGSEYYNATTKHGYEITYHRPAENKTPEPDVNNLAIIDATHIRWTANDATSGYVQQNSFHRQSYWPQWIAGDELKFAGTKLASTAYDTSGKGTNYVLPALAWGYVDNLPNAQEKGFKIDWAVDSDGKSVKLKRIHFIRVYCAMNQSCGWVGETSTEVSGAEDLHVK